MPTLTHIEGFEHGFGTLNSNGAGLANTVAGGATVQGTTYRSGAYALKILASGSAALTKWLRTVTTSAVTVSSVFFRWTTAPSAACEVFSHVGAGFTRVYFDPADNKLYVNSNGVTTAKTAALTQNVWYRLDLRTNLTANPNLIDFSLNGTALTQLSNAVAASTTTQVQLGWYATSVTGEVYFDDLVVSNTSADYPLGDHKVLALRPNGEGTHTVTANTVEDQAGNDINGTTVIAYTKINSNPMGNTTNYLMQNGTGNVYAEVTLEDLAVGDTDVWGVDGLIAYTSASTSANNAATWIRDGSTDLAIKGAPGALADYSDGSTSNLYWTRAFNLGISAKTRTVVNALTLRFGYSGDATPDPYLIDAMLEVAIGVTDTVDDLVSKNAITPVATVDKSTIAQKHVLTNKDVVTPVPTVGKPTLSELVALVSKDIITPAPTVDKSSIAIIYSLVDKDVVTDVPTVTKSIVGQVHVLVDKDVVTDVSVVTKSTIGQIHVLVGKDAIGSAVAVDKPTLAIAAGTDSLVSRNAVAAEPTVENPSVGQIHVLVSVTVSSGEPEISKPSDVPFQKPGTNQRNRVKRRETLYYPEKEPEPSWKKSIDAANAAKLAKREEEERINRIRIANLRSVSLKKPDYTNLVVSVEMKKVVQQRLEANLEKKRQAEREIKEKIREIERATALEKARKVIADRIARDEEIKQQRIRNLKKARKVKSKLQKKK